MGLPKLHRLKKRRDFRAVYEQGIRRYSPHLILRAWLTTDPKQSSVTDHVNPTAIGISVGKKVSKKAVIRNRIKRQIAGAIKELLPSITPGWQVVIIVKSEAIECKYEHFLRELNQLLTEATIINGH
ncbi:MAG: ribonuclease P protein component [Pleurocapsa sp.]